MGNEPSIPYQAVRPRRVIEQNQQPLTKAIPMPTPNTVVYANQQPPTGYYEEVVGADSGNTTVFMWVTSISTCCASVCTLIVLVCFVIWVFLNNSRQTWFP